MTDSQAISAAENLKNLMNRYYAGNHEMAAAGKPVVWAAIIAPMELLKGFDLAVMFPENHAAMCAAKGVGAQQAAKAEEQGFSPDLCSYARIDLGTVFDQGQGSPSMGLPKPDLLISDLNNCSLLAKWFDVHHRAWNVPHFILDVPFCYEKQQIKDLNYIRSQFRDLIRTIEDLTGQTWDEDKVREALEHSNQATAHWKRFLDLAAHKPAGITAFDTFLHMAPYLTWMRGAPEMTEHYRLLADEAEARVAAGQFPVPNEKYRLLWDNIAPWHQLRKMYKRLAGLSANIVYACYTSCMGTIEGGVDAHYYKGGDPLEHLARIQNFSVCPYGLDLRFKAMAEMIDRFAIDGVVFCSNPSCKVYSVMQHDLMTRVRRELGVETVMIEMDHADERKYNEEAAFLRIETMLQSME